MHPGAGISGIIQRFLRIKIILFRDFQCCSIPIEESDFFTIPDQSNEFTEFIDRIEYKGGYGYCNALEAIALALKSDWVKYGLHKLYNILVISNGIARELGKNQVLTKHYPADMPETLARLGMMWVSCGLHQRRLVYILVQSVVRGLSSKRGVVIGRITPTLEMPN